jgi:hypothetical protein
VHEDFRESARTFLMQDQDAEASVGVGSPGAARPRATTAVNAAVGPTVYAVLERQWARNGYLPTGWRQASLTTFDSQPADMRAQLESGGSEREVVLYSGLAAQLGRRRQADGIRLHRLGGAAVDQ